ncbi:DUF1624 domain-containing protein [Novosphingobium album (ex Hu et al. 2023)]|uniref:Heparan-alpha-glucosaminide N-acetyltransferase domain-containing protein n=1 Tax=Novosphingobium album (ex Hu et al. 2023) TaxID=2930093 RepID=A0ABT0B798_9SPHN|nr:heparan-alpha-glucosaminide N-acetyltransferase domain-containing protein [Novosphingobium album (ex Hu et al. 2023)]MCJ2180940.1 heparan-alpha-glucosaminide N-acetyltransferase domain-containing protein [Novosphingobium album (ex Hu et al. 2023)]
MPRAEHPAVTARVRLQSIDALRGLIMVIMLFDHVREAWFLYMPVNDPLDVTQVAPSLFFSRSFSNICAPNFVFLTGLGAWLYSQHHTKAETSSYLLTRGLFLLAIELCYMSVIWMNAWPMTFYLQVIWAIGISMIALAALIHLPRWAIVSLGLLIVCGHNLLDPIRFEPGDPLFVPWALLHQRDTIDLPLGFHAKTSYPVLAWIGVIALGWSIGPWFGKGADALLRQKRLLLVGLGMIAAFIVLRSINVYGDTPWTPGNNGLQTFMAFVALTKYPPSLMFLLLFVGMGLLLLWFFEKVNGASWLGIISVFGAAPMFFYLMHITVLQIMYHIAYALFGPNHGAYYGFDNISSVWLFYFLMIPVFYVPTVWFSKYKQAHREKAWLKYF